MVRNRKKEREEREKKNISKTLSGLSAESERRCCAPPGGDPDFFFLDLIFFWVYNIYLKKELCVSLDETRVRRRRRSRFSHVNANEKDRDWADIRDGVNHDDDDKITHTHNF